MFLEKDNYVSISNRCWQLLSNEIITVIKNQFLCQNFVEFDDGRGDDNLFGSSVDIFLFDGRNFF